MWTPLNWPKKLGLSGSKCEERGLTFGCKDYPIHLYRNPWIIYEKISGKRSCKRKGITSLFWLSGGRGARSEAWLSDLDFNYWSPYLYWWFDTDWQKYSPSHCNISTFYLNTILIFKELFSQSENSFLHNNYGQDCFVHVCFSQI